jgi:hypothetical protein
MKKVREIYLEANAGSTICLLQLLEEAGPVSRIPLGLPS